MTDKIVALSTCESQEDAIRIANHLVEHQLAACVNILPGITSVYRWKGKIERAGEFLLVIKTSSALLENLKQELKTIHPYDVPELVAVTIVDGAESYLDWMSEQLMM
jgi:periplasmic divalent cation tolerance protein